VTKNRRPDLSLFETPDEEIGCIERNLESQQSTSIIGVDEVGRGTLAGPVVAAAVSLPSGYIPIGLNDSKKLKKSERERLYIEINANALCIGVSFISAVDIDRVNILNASLKAMMQAVDQTELKLPHFSCLCLVDGNQRMPCDRRQQTIVGGDGKSSNIAAASVVAKVVRDAWMETAAVFYPGYGFEKHKGYGTEVHRKAVKELGPCFLHRKTFAGVKENLSIRPIKDQEQV